MSGQEIFVKALQKSGLYTNSEEEMIQWHNQDRTNFDIRGIFLTHKFAKAFWGEEIYYHFCESLMPQKELTLNEIKELDEEYLIDRKDTYIWHQVAWKFHLQQMILELNPLKYLEKFLDEHNDNENNIKTIENSKVGKIKGFEISPIKFDQFIKYHLRVNESIPIDEIHCFYKNGRIQKFNFAKNY